MCFRILDFLLNRPETVKLNDQFFKPIIPNTSAPQGRMLSPLLYSLFTSDCVSHHKSVLLIKFADDMTMEGLVDNGDESAGG